MGSGERQKDQLKGQVNSAQEEEMNLALKKKIPLY